MSETLADLIGRAAVELKAMEAACPCKTQAWCGVACGCRGYRTKCNWPGHATNARLREALLAIVEAWRDGDYNLAWNEERRTAARERLK